MEPMMETAPMSSGSTIAASRVSPTNVMAASSIVATMVTA